MTQLLYPTTLSTAIIKLTQQTNQSIFSMNHQHHPNQTRKAFEKLDKLVQNLILNTASPNNEIAAATSPNACELFYNYKLSSHGNERLNFIQSLKHTLSSMPQLKNQQVSLHHYTTAVFFMDIQRFAQQLIMRKGHTTLMRRDVWLLSLNVLH